MGNIFKELFSLFIAVSKKLEIGFYLLYMLFETYATL